MPPWSQMTPQQQMMLLQMMHGGGMQQPMGAPGQVQPGLNASTQALTNQLANPQMGMNPQMLQYLMGMRGQGMAPPNLAQFLAGRGAAPWAAPQQPAVAPWAPPQPPASMPWAPPQASAQPMPWAGP